MDRKTRERCEFAGDVFHGLVLCSDGNIQHGGRFFLHLYYMRYARAVKGALYTFLSEFWRAVLTSPDVMIIM